MRIYIQRKEYPNMYVKTDTKVYPEPERDKKICFK